MGSNPRRWSDRLLLVTNLAAANAVAAVWLASFLHPGSIGIDAEPAALGGRRAVVVPLDTMAAWLGFAGALVLLVWNFAWLVRPRADRSPHGWILSETPGGTVRVARDAVESALQKAGEALPAITRVRAQLDTTQQKRLGVTVQFHCAEGQDHLAASQRLRHALAERLAELVRLGAGRRLELELEFQGFLGKAGKPVAEPAAEEHVPFTGPKYPIDDELGGTA